MKNPFQEIKDRADTKRLQEEEEQRQREARLQQLEADKEQSGIHFPHPVKAIKRKKEIKSLRKEIAAFEQKKKDKKLYWGLFAALVVMFSILGIMAIKEHRVATNAVKSPNPASPPVSSETSTSRPTDNTPLTPADHINTSDKATPTTPSNPQPASSGDSPEVDSSQLEGLAKLTASDLRIYTRTDYSHIDTETILLGQNEGVTITIEAPGIDFTSDDIIIDYDESLLHEDVTVSEDTNKNVTMKIYVTGLGSGETDLTIFTAYDLASKSMDDLSGYILHIHKLDSTDGRIVFVTPTGEKYHFSESCAGENSITTTYYDVISCEYSPCGKCAG